MRSLRSAALVAAALGLAVSGGLAQRGIIESTPKQTIINPAGARGDGKKKRKGITRYLVEMQHGKPGTRAARRNREFRRPAVGNCGSGDGNRTAKV